MSIRTTGADLVLEFRWVRTHPQMVQRPPTRPQSSRLGPFPSSQIALTFRCGSPESNGRKDHSTPVALVTAAVLSVSDRGHGIPEDNSCPIAGCLWRALANRRPLAAQSGHPRITADVRHHGDRHDGHQAPPLRQPTRAGGERPASAGTAVSRAPNRWPAADHPSRKAARFRSAP
jgi:hypothetical protein